jgi:long-chain fatty acid transport protein
MIGWRQRLSVGLMMVLASVWASSAAAQYGPLLTGAGPINRSIAGASTALPLDTLGAFLWNPATLTALPNSADMALEVFMPYASLSSEVDAGAFGPGMPPMDVGGRTASESGAFPIPNFGFVYRPDDSRMSYGVGLMTLAGFGVNYPGSPENPLVSPRPPQGFGVGPIFSQYILLQIAPTLAYQLTDQLSISFSPLINIASLAVDPGILAAPDMQGGQPVYPPLTHTGYHWGGGFMFGAWYETDYDIDFGISYRSLQSFVPFQYASSTPNGSPRTINFLVDAPPVLSIGAAYRGFEHWKFACDLRYLNFEATTPYSASGFTPEGGVRGLDVTDMFAVATGAEYSYSEATRLRIGYSYNTKPIGEDQAFANVASPFVMQQAVTLGGTYDISDRFNVSVAYAHFFTGSVSGPWQTPRGPIPGTNVTSELSADGIDVGVGFKY